MLAVLIATLTEAPTAELLTRLSSEADWLEIRADLVGDLSPAEVRRYFSGKLLYTLRSCAEGGENDDASPRRHARLLAAVDGYDLVDLEADRDLSPAILERLEPENRLISWHGPPSSAAALRSRFDQMAAHHARYFKLIPAADEPSEALATLALLHSLERSDVISFASGEAGTWTRLLAPRLGAPVVYGAVGERPGAPGQLSLTALCQDYGLPDLPPVERIFGIVGDPVRHSLSPRIHNGAYRQLGLPALYLPFAARSFGDFWLDLVERGSLRELGMPLSGLSVTAPHKDSALAIAGASSPLAQRLGAANTLVPRGRVWEAETTDAAGTVEALEAHGVELRGRSAAVVGAGGAGRAAAIGMALAGARVTLVNRSVESGRRAAARIGLPFRSLEAFTAAGHEILVNATSLGHRADDPLPFDPTTMAPGGVVLDMVYTQQATPLIAAARAAGLGTVGGREVLLHQAIGQFRMMTGQSLPLDLARQLLRLTPAAGA